ncbi:MAG: FAD-binding protein [Candidatus Eisenbacteria bacterium]|nr:FAD-binding protein [Candidatus Eisenbacteria bacterium]
MPEIKYIDGYPEYMRKSIEIVNGSRTRRRGAVPAAMSADEREKTLLVHPDYAPGGKRKLEIGPNAGEEIPVPVADLLESYPLIDESEVDLSVADHEVDVLIIGGGLAGTAAALWADDAGVDRGRILLVNKLRHGDCNSIMAEGGTQAADRPADPPDRHYLDTIGGGHYANKPGVVRALVEDAPLIMHWLETLGAVFDKEDNGDYVENWGGGTSARRMHSCRDYTGLEEFRVLRDEFRTRRIPSVEHSPAVELTTDSRGRVTGAVLYNLETGAYQVVGAKAVVLATGGFGRLHIRGFPTTNHYGATADGLVLAYRAGAKLRDADTVQYHPTGAAYPIQIVGFLLTEKLRSAGAQPVNKDGEAFVFPLEPRDVEASAIIRECYVRENGIVTPSGLRGVWLDTPLIDAIHGDGYIDRAFPAMKRMYARFDIDMTTDPVLVFPTLHYQNGGVETDPDGATNVESLWVAGEVSGGVHGKNRLMGNSTLDTMVFGRRAGMAAAAYVKSANTGQRTLQHAVRFADILQDAGVDSARRAPMLLPEYRGKAALARMIDVW